MLGPHSSLMLADRKLVKASEMKARDIVELRQVIQNLDIDQAIKDEIIFSLNKEAENFLRE